MKRKIISGIMLTVLSVSILTLVFNIQMATQASSASGWLNDWSYRKAHVINPASGAGTNYQIKIRVHYGNGTDSGEDVYLNTHSRTDFGDVRFTDDDGTTELDYWMEEKVDGDYAIFWVEVADDLSSSSQTIYIYYGNSDATTTSNGTNTFIAWDDFDLGYSVGDVPKISRGWTYKNDATIQTDPDDASNKVLRIRYNGTTSNARNWLNMKYPGLAVNVRNRIEDNQNAWVFYFIEEGNGTARFNSYRDAYSGRLKWFNGLVYNDFTPQLNYTLSDWHDCEYQIIKDVSCKLEFDDSLYSGGFRSAVETGIGDIGLLYVNGEGNVMYWDSFYVRKFTDPEPTHGSWDVKVYVDQPLGYIPGVTPGGTVAIDIIIEVGNISDNSSEGIVGWGLYVQVDPDVLNITRAQGAVNGYFLWEFADYEWLNYPILYTFFNATEGFGDVSEFISLTPSGGAGEGYSGLKLVTLEFISKSETAYSKIDLFNIEYMTPDGMWHPVKEVIDGQYNPSPAPDLDIEGILLPYISPVPLIYPTPDPEFFYKINATVINLGTSDAGSFNVSFSVHLNETEVPEYARKKTISGLAQGVNETVWFDFMPEDYGNYTLIIEADCDNDVAELDETNNVKTTWVIGTVRGDVDGDGDVDRYDCGYFAFAYGRRFEQPPYDPADLDYDGDVDRYDCGILAQNYGKTV